jgi:hypothetical protein
VLKEIALLNFCALLAWYFVLRNNYLPTSSFVGGLIHLLISQVLASLVFILFYILFLPVVNITKDPYVRFFLYLTIGVLAFMLVFHLRYGISLYHAFAASLLFCLFALLANGIFFLWVTFGRTNSTFDTWRQDEEEKAYKTFMLRRK